MPRPSPALPRDLPTLHLYRNLLRESSYLPPAWRWVVLSNIKKRFRTHRLNDAHEEKHRDHANQVLGTIRAANNGNKKSMEKLILKAFARKGPRRRQILSRFVQPDGPQTSEDLEALLSAGPTTRSVSASSEDVSESRESNHQKPSGLDNSTITPTEVKKHEFLDKWDLRKVRQLLRSQREVQKHSNIVWLNRDIKSLDEKNGIPELNIWGKPVNENIIRNMKAKFWLRSIDKMMVPLGKGEWNLLRKLSQGSQNLAEWKVPKRRPTARSAEDDQQPSSEWNWETYADKPIQMVERHRKNSAPDALKGPYLPHYRETELSPRWFRRAYKQVWALTPKIEQDPRTLTREIKWGSSGSHICAASDAQMNIFEGYDSKGKKSNPLS